MPLIVFVNDNYHYMDPDERYRLGEYDTLEAATDACKEVVEGCLTELYEPEMGAAALYARYTMFGDDPWIAGSAITAPFSAWNYAKQRCEEICAPMHCKEKQS